MKQMPLKETDDDDEVCFFAAIALGLGIGLPSATALLIYIPI